MEEKMKGVGVTAYALMAAGGDLGALVAPQAMGIVVDLVSASEWATAMAAELGVGADRIGMKVGMLLSSAFPILGLLLLVFTLRYFRRKNQNTSI